MEAVGGSGPGHSSSTCLAVCIATYGRPGGLSRLLASLATTASTVDAADRPFLVVIDNDAEGGAASVIERRREMFPWPILYAVEARRGLSSVRNRAIDVALDAGATFIAFIDDDEVALPGWPSELVAVHRATGAPIVTGPIVARFDVIPPAWIVRAGVLDLPTHADRSELHYAMTGNVLIHESVVRDLHPAFDPRYNLSGGEDTHFFERARLAGHRIVWAATASVVEVVGSNRTTLRWVLRRELRRGTTLSLVLKDLQPSPSRIAKRAGASILHILQGILRIVVSPLGGRAAAARGLHRIAFGIGQLTGLFGHRPLEYGEARAHVARAERRAPGQPPGRTS